MEKFAPAAFPWCNHPRQSSLSRDIWDDIAPRWTLAEQFAVRGPQVYLCWPRALISASKSDDVKIFTSALHFGFGSALRSLHYRISGAISMHPAKIISHSSSDFPLLWAQMHAWSSKWYHLCRRLCTIKVRCFHIRECLAHKQGCLLLEQITVWYIQESRSSRRWTPPSTKF